MLTKHGGREDQNEEGLVNRINHMMDFLEKVYKSDFVQSREYIIESFWKIAIWHLRRYFYLDAQMNGNAALRDEVMQSNHAMLLRSWIHDALKNWQEYGKRWEEPQRADYKYLLQFIMDGNEFLYKAKNYWLWKLNPRLSALRN